MYLFLYLNSPFFSFFSNPVKARHSTSGPEWRPFELHFGGRTRGPRFNRAYYLREQWGRGPVSPRRGAHNVPPRTWSAMVR